MTVKLRGSFDILSVTWLFGANYLLMFGLSAVDGFFDLGHSSSRLSEHFADYRGVSLAALAYVWAGFGLFVFGYKLSLGRKLAGLIHRVFSFVGRRSRFVSGRRFFLYSLLLFGLTFPVMVLAVQRFGAGRLAGVEDFDPSASSQYVAGEVAFVVYALGVWRFMLSKRPGARRMPRGFGGFVWGGMFTLQIALCVWLGSRTRLMTVLLVAVLAYHYGYRRIRTRVALLGGVLLLGMVLPIVAFQRELVEGRPSFSSASSVTAWGWNSMMKRYSALEGFTVTFEHMKAAPEPDSLSLIFTSGLIPRFVWPNKPFSTWSERFSSWATDLRTSTFFPSLPGELLLHFGYVGGLIAMMVLGIGWRTLFAYLLNFNDETLGFLYLVLLSQAVAQLEVGFVIPSGALLRSIVLSLSVFFLITKSRGPARRMRGIGVADAPPSVTGPVQISN